MLGAEPNALLNTFAERINKREESLYSGETSLSCWMGRKSKYRNLKQDGVFLEVIPKVSLLSGTFLFYVTYLRKMSHECELE